MTYSMMVGKYKLIFSDTHFKDFRKKPTISVYDADANCEIKIASFNSKETFEWFINELAEQTEPSSGYKEGYRDGYIVGVKVGEHHHSGMVEQTEPHTERSE